jgi:hypothetical protein
MRKPTENTPSHATSSRNQSSPTPPSNNSTARYQKLLQYPILGTTLAFLPDEEL